ncbi:MAG: hypothetical protein JKY95_03705, partial [Planctomycetaceae bacterium]|nr:hypothetical protein [Planctomycetaceae bacterium]
MRLVMSLLVLLTVLIFPVTGYSGGWSGVNTKPLLASNYPLWPGIMDVVNLPARQHQSWVNGNEYLSYRGDTEALNATLIQFAKIKSP